MITSCGAAKATSRRPRLGACKSLLAHDDDTRFSFGRTLEQGPYLLRELTAVELAIRRTCARSRAVITDGDGNTRSSICARAPAA